MRVVFKVDASHRIGIGHVMRCMVLANALRKKGHEVTFLCRELPGNYIFVLVSKNFNVISLPYVEDEEATLYNLPLHQQWLGASRDIDLKQTLTHLAGLKNTDWLVVDHYGIDAQWEIACRKYVKKIMVIDDLADRLHDSDILIDQNYYNNSKNRYKGLIPDACNVLIGPKYALLRPEFHLVRQTNVLPRNGKVKRLMISLGGSDVMNGTRLILEGIMQSSCWDLDIDVVLGASSKHKDDIRALCASHNKYHFHCPSNNMADIMKHADLAIGAGGTTTWERCCLGLPSLVLKIADNQEEIIKEGVAANLFDYLGDITLVRENDIIKKLNEMVKLPGKLKAMSENGMNLVDGLGVERVIEKMLAI